MKSRSVEVEFGSARKGERQEESGAHAGGKSRLRSLLSSGLVALALVASWGVNEASTQEVPSTTAPNAFYLELFGNGLLYSLNYDRLFTDQISGRVGIMFLGAAEGESAAGVMAAPIMANYLVGRGNSHFEAGVGVALVSGAISNVEGFEDESFSGVAGTGTLGYRYQRPAGGFVFRAGLTPFFSTSGIVPWFGLSLGYGF